MEVLVSYFSCNIPTLSETLSRKLPEGEGTPCPKQTIYLKYKWQEQDLSSQPQLVQKWIFNHYAIQAEVWCRSMCKYGLGVNHFKIKPTAGSFNL